MVLVVRGLVVRWIIGINVQMLRKDRSIVQNNLPPRMQKRWEILTLIHVILVYGCKH